MSDETEKQDEQAEEKPKRRRTRAKAKPAEGEAKAEAKPAEKKPAEKKPARSRARAKKDEEPKAEEAKADDTKAEEKTEEEKPARKPAPSRKRDADEKPVTPAVVRAQAKYVRSSARKARLVCEHIRGKDVDEARAILRFTPRAVARDWSKLLESAVANAEHNHELVGDDLLVSEAYADEGPTLKRYRPRAMGRATRIRKRTSHLTIKLTPKETI
jgi:ribosomal protein L22